MQTTVNKRVKSGYWLIFELTRSYGGPEEGGWWYDSGNMIACIPAERECLTEQTWNDNGYWDEQVTEWLGKREDNKALVEVLKALTEMGYAEDGEYCHVRPRHESIAVRWDDEIVTHFPEQRPFYE